MKSTRKAGSNLGRQDRLERGGKGTRAEQNRRAEADGALSPEEFFKRSTHVEESIVINRTAEELYAFFRNFENLPRFMDHLKEVRVLDGERSHWCVKAPAGGDVEWDAQIINEEPGRLIAWRSVGDAQVDNAGSVRFLPIGADGSGSTEVKVTLDYIPPGGKLGAFVARMFGEDPRTQVREDLRRFKELMEGGSAGARTQ
jgi:uncharacterized membrane protein